MPAVSGLRLALQLQQIPRSNPMFEQGSLKQI